MKKIKNIIILIISCTTILSCSEDDKTVSLLLDNVERGVVLRTILTENTNTSFNLFDTSSEWFVTVEAQGPEKGKLLSEVRIFAQFNDLTLEEGETDYSTTEVGPVKTVPAGAFSEIGPNGFPRASLSMSLSEALNFTGVDFDNLTGGDSFTFRIELVLTDGRVFTNDASGTVTGGSFFSSPFNYTSSVLCFPPPPVGDWLIDLADSFGDGWNGGFITVTIDGTATDYTLDDGSSGSQVVNIPDGTQSLEFTYTAGGFNEEVSFTITAPSGNVVGEESAPADGVIGLNLCNE